MSGPMQNAQDEGKGWRDKIGVYAAEFGTDDLEFVSPWDKHPPGTTIEEARAEWTDAEIMRQDRLLIADSDGMIVHLPEGVVSIGTAREIEYAVWTLNLPVVVVMDAANERLDRTPWLDDVLKVETFTEAIAHFHRLAQHAS